MVKAKGYKKMSKQYPYGTNMNTFSPVCVSEELDYKKREDFMQALTTHCYSQLQIIETFPLPHLLQSVTWLGIWPPSYSSQSLVIWFFCNSAIGVSLSLFRCAENTHTDTVMINIHQTDL